MIKENKVQMLTGTKFPLCSYQVSGYFGSKSTGKTTLINKISNEFIRQAETTKYNLDEPFINNGPISHFIYVSPSIISDNTLKTQKEHGLQRIDIELNDINIDRVCDYIYKMRNDMAPMLELQDQLRTFLKNKETYDLMQYLLQNSREIYRYPQIQNLQTIILMIEQTKVDYPPLITPETNQTVKANLKILYQLFGRKFDGNLLRVQKIILNFDDSTTSTKFVQFQNSPILRLITQARHLYIFSLNIVMHSLSATYSIFKEQFNVIVLHKGIQKKEQLESMFDTCGLETSNFKKEDFVNLYQQHVGANIDNYDEREKYKYNFLCIFKDPITRIYKGLDERFK